MADETKKFLDEAGVAELYKIICDQLQLKLERTDILNIIQEIIPIETNNDNENITYVYGGSASELI